MVRATGPTTEINGISIRTEEPAFGFVQASLSTGQSSVLEVFQTPAGDGDAEIIINGLTAKAATVSTTGKGADQVNNELVAALQSEGFVAHRLAGRIVVPGATSISWEDSDSGITAVGTISEVKSIPTLTPLGLLLLTTLLSGTALVFLRMRTGG